jgi:hypothetical protein
LKRISEEYTDDERDVHKDAENGMLGDVHDDDLLDLVTITQVPKAAKQPKDYEHYVNIGMEKCREEVPISFHAAMDGHHLAKREVMLLNTHGTRQ